LRVKIALFFTLLFSILLITPSVISLIDDSQHIAFFLDMNEEEEENKGKETSKDLEIKFHSTDSFGTLRLDGIQKKRNVRFQSKNYTSEYPKKTTPPPEFLS
jgi:SUMO ligase MMS21 Smc5/6 complex component